MKRWPGGFIQTLVTKTDDQHRAGKGIVWLNNDNENRGRAADHRFCI